MDIKELQMSAHAIAKEKGWHDSIKTVEDLIALCYSELSEALEDYCAGYDLRVIYETKAELNKTPKPYGFPIELADLLILVADMAEHWGIDLEDAINRKMAYNQTRPHRYGGKTI